MGQQSEEINKSSPRFRRGVEIERKRNPSLSAKMIDALVTYNLIEHPHMYRMR